MPALEDISHCGCLLPIGFWGSDGWHWARADQQMLYTREKRRFTEERARRGVPAAVIGAEWSDWLEMETKSGRLVNGMHELWKSSIGLPFAMERCPPYMAEYRKTLEARKKKLAKEKKSGKLLDEEPDAPAEPYWQR